MNVASVSDRLILLRGGEPFFDAMIGAINQAQKSLHLMFYILAEDSTGMMVLDALCRAASRGVRVHLIVDGYGSNRLSEKRHKQLVDAGIQYHAFAPVKGFGLTGLGRRMHVKVLLCDYEIALVSGINIADRYRGSSAHIAWLDYAVWIKGPAARKLVSLYELFAKRSFLLPRRMLKKEQIIRQVTYKTDGDIHWLVNDRLRGFNHISKSYLLAIRRARKEIIILNSYFWPGLRYLKALKKAGERGVTIRLILPALSDNAIFRNSSRYFYRVLFRIRNTCIYEWKKSVLHGKVALTDHNWATVGSYNMNILSELRSIELNAEIVDPGFVEELRKELYNVISQSDKVDPDDFRRRSGRIGATINMISYYLLHWGLLLLLFFSRKD